MGQEHYKNEVAWQSSMGTFDKNSNERDKSWNRGYLAFGEVTKVFPKRYTAEVKIFHSNDKYNSKDEQEGRHACKIGVGTAGFNNTYQMPYGEIMPIQRGNIVLVGFLKNSSEQPVIIRVFHDVSESNGNINYRNILPGEHDAAANTGDIWDYLKISPIQDFTKVDRFGNIEMASHTKSFFVVKDMLDDENFDFEDLSVKFPRDKTVINTLDHISDEYQSTDTTMTSTSDEYYSNDKDEVSPEVGTVHVAEKWSKPKKWMAVFRDKFSDELTNWLRVIVDAGKTSLRILKSQRTPSTPTPSEKGKTGACTLAEIDAAGSIKFRRQLDTRTLTDYTIPLTEDNPNQSPSKQYSDVQMLSNGGMIIQTVDKTQTIPNKSENSTGSDNSNNTDGNTDSDTTYPHTLIYIAPSGGGISIETTAQITVSAKKGIMMTTEESIMMNADKNIVMQAKESISMVCKKTDNSSSAFQMTEQGTAAMMTTNGGDDGTNSALQLSAVGAGGAAIQTSTGGDNGTSSVISMKAAGTMDQQATSKVTTATSGSMTEMTPGGITNRGAKVETYGSQKSVGNANHIGNATFTGAHKINGRPAILMGDRDSHGYRNWAVFSKALISIAQSFVTAKATEMVASKLPGVAAIAGIVDIAMKGFQNFQALGWNGMSVTMEGAMKAAMISPSSPFYGKFQSFASNIPGGTTSLAVGMQFLTDPKGLNIDMETLAVQAASMTPVAGTLHTTMALYNSFGQPNSMGELVDNGVVLAEAMVNNAVGAAGTAFTPQKVENTLLTAACNKVNVQFDPNSMDGNIGEFGTTVDDLKDMVSIDGLIKPGTKTVKENNAGNGGSGDKTVEIATIGDAVNEMSKYAPNIKDQILVAAKEYDAQNGTNSAQWVNTNRKNTRTTGGNNGEDKTKTTGPSPITNQDQYIAAMIEGTVLNSYRQGLSATNNAMKSYVCNRNTDDMTDQEKTDQQAQIQGIMAADKQANADNNNG